MIYYRLVVDTTEDLLKFTDIVEQEVDEESFQKMNWEKPIIRHYDGKYYHFLALSHESLECFLAGMAMYQDFTISR